MKGEERGNGGAREEGAGGGPRQLHLGGFLYDNEMIASAPVQRLAGCRLIRPHASCPWAQ